MTPPHFHKSLQYRRSVPYSRSAPINSFKCVRAYSQCTKVQLHSLLGRQQAVHEERGHEVDHVIATEDRLSARGEEEEK